MKSYSLKFKIGFYFLVVVFSFAFCSPNSQTAQAASLSLSPSAGAFVVGGTFDVSVFLDTENESVNTISVFIKFPADKIQLISPSTGQSIVDIWLTAPKFNNATGVIELKGGMPGGFNVDGGLVTKLTFRVRGVGQGVLRFLDDSRVLLNDGLGTEVLRHTQSAIYDFELPPPAGPIVVSSTHPVQANWYPSSSAVFNWSYEEGVGGYSYVLSDEMIDIPDDISEGARNSATYKNLVDGRHYFHIKSLRNGKWGGVTHYLINVDTKPPADFPVEILSGDRTTKRQPVVQFNTTDSSSGVDHYELKLIPLSQIGGKESGKAGFQDFFVEVVDSVFKFISEKGIEISGRVVLSWWWFWSIAVILVFGIGYLAWFLRKQHYVFEKIKEKKELPEHIQQKLTELKKYRDKYGNVLVLALLICSFFFFGQHAFAGNVEFGPPIVTAVSKNIANDEIFYIGGKTDAMGVEVILYLQNIQTGETLSQKVVSDKRGDWFYRHDSFLTSGSYMLWCQSKIGEELSPPSPQISMAVRSTAIQLGSSRISYETFYLGAIIILLAVLLGLVLFIIFHAAQTRRKRVIFMKEINEAEEAVRRGFAVLRRDIQAELALLRRGKLNKELSAEAKIKEGQLLGDLEEVERHIGKEVFDIEKAEYLRS